MKIERRLVIGFLGAAGLALAFLCCVFLRSGETAQLNFQEAVRLELSGREADGVEVLTAELPGDWSGQAVMFKTTHVRVEILKEGRVLYRWGWEETAPDFLSSPGTRWHVVDLPEDAGGTLELWLYPAYPGFYGSTTELFFGTREGCILELLERILPILVVNCVIVFAGILSLLLYVATRRKRQKYEMGGFLCLGLFALVIVVWSLCQSGFLQPLIPDSRTLYFVDFFSFFLFPVPFDLFVYTICRTRYRRGFAWLAGAYLANMAVVTAIQLTGWRDIFQMMSITHVLMAANVVYVLWAIQKEVKLTGSETARRFRVPLYIVMAFGFAELAAYYVNGFRQTSVFLPLGTIVFIIMLVWIQVSQYYRAMLEEQKLAYLEKLANTDILTEALNRNAYEDTLRRLEQQELEVKATGVVLFDINDMKHINDCFGHEKGDEALKCCYHCICQAFDPDGQCFRIGGDEFVYLTSKRQDLAEGARRFQELVDQASWTLDFPFGVSMGYASYDEGRDRTIRDVIRRSDAMMYEDKRRRGSKAGSEI